MRITMIAMTGLAAVALTACGQGGDKAPADGTGTTGGTPPAGAIDAPRPGLWRITTAIEGMPAGVAMPPMETCVTSRTWSDAQSGPNGKMPEGVDCTAPSFRREGAAMIGRSVCALPNGARTETETRATGDFDSRYTMEIRSRTTPAPTPSLAETVMTMTAERLGDCPADAGQAASGQARR